MLARIRKSIKEKDAGFTLVELLVVMIIIGILAAIAIPVFLNQRKKAVDTAVKSDMRNVAQEVETFFVDNGTYPVGTTYVAAGTGASQTSPTVAAAARLSSGTTVTYKAVTNGYCLRGQGANGNANATDATYFWWSSVAGGAVAGAATATVPTGC